MLQSELARRVEGPITHDLPGRGMTEEPSAAFEGSFAVTASSAAAAALIESASRLTVSVKPQQGLQPTVYGGEKHLCASGDLRPRLGTQQPQSSAEPLVLTGRLNYTFATRTALDTDVQQKKTEGFSISSSSSSTSSSSTRCRSSVAAANAADVGGAGEASSPRLEDVSRTTGGAGNGVPFGLRGSSAEKETKCSSRITSPGPGQGTVVRPSESADAAKEGKPDSSSNSEPASNNNPSVSSRSVSNSKDNNPEGDCTGSSGSSDTPKRQFLRVLAPDVALLLRDFATFIRRIERDVRQLQRQQLQGEQTDDEAHGQKQQQKPWWERPAESSDLLLQRQNQQHEAQGLRRSIDEGTVVCRSLHARLSALLVDTAAAASLADGNDLLLAKLRRDFAQQQQHYTRLMRLLDASAELLQEPRSGGEQPEQQHATSVARVVAGDEQLQSAADLQEAPAARIIWRISSSGPSGGRVKIDASYFAPPQSRNCVRNISGGSAAVASDGETSAYDGRGLLHQGSEVGLPRLLIENSRGRGTSSGAPQEEGNQEYLWEPTALVAVDEDYEQQQIIRERKQQLQQLQQVERCVSVLRELQLHVAADVGKGEQMLQAVEDDTEAAADYTAAGAGELAAAARSKSRWWGVQGGGAAALLGVSVGAVAGGPIGAAVGAVVGAVAGVSSGAALRVRHRERILAVERSIRRRRAQRLKRSSVAATGATSPNRRASAGAPAASGGAPQSASESAPSTSAVSVAGPQPVSGSSANTSRHYRTGVYNLEGTASSTAVPLPSSQTANGGGSSAATRGPTSKREVPDTRQQRGSSAAPSVATNQQQGEGQQHAQPQPRRGTRRSGAGTSNASRHRGSGSASHAVSLRASLAIQGLLPAFEFAPK